MCEYKIIAPPFTLKFKEMSKKELEDYNRWYLDQMPNRLAGLEMAVKCAHGFEDWKADYRPESLDRLGAWFAGQVETRERTEEEDREILARFPPGMTLKDLKIDNRELTNRTFSIAIDVGMYLSQVFLKEIHGLEWQHKTKGSKNWVDYGQPVLAGFGLRVFNPTRMMVVQAYGIADGSRGGASLRQLFEIWRGMAVA